MAALRIVILGLVACGSRAAIIHCTARKGCDCDCSWAHADTCLHDDGSCCFECCCDGPPPSPSPSPTPSPSPSPPPSPTPSPSPELYCPSAKELGKSYGEELNGDFLRKLGGNLGTVNITDQGWSITGGGGVHTRTAFDLLGGYIEFDMDTSQAHVGINNNLYTISPDLHGGAFDDYSLYCDGQAPKSIFCIEMDIIEANGNCGGQTTSHTQPGHGGGCDASGCSQSYRFSGQTKFHVKSEFAANGDWSTTVGGTVVQRGSMNPKPDDGSLAAVASNFTKRGAVISSTQWQGWVPLSDQCGGSGDLASSTFSISNLRIMGSVVSGPVPHKCPALEASSAPTAAPHRAEEARVGDVRCDARGGCTCDCSSVGPDACAHDDGSCCFGCCCDTAGGAEYVQAVV